MSDQNERLIQVGRVGGAFGVRGEMRITTFTETPLALRQYGDLLNADGSVALVLTSARQAKDGLIVRAKGVESKESADALRGLTLHVPRDALPEPEEDEFYLTDLIGLAAVAPDGADLGVIRTVQNFGAGDLLEIQPKAGASWWAPFTREVVPEVNIAAGKVVIDRPVEVSDQ